jgi:hypothetical protein
MAKIRINKLPDGFEIKDGKVVKKMQQGGMMTGDQSNYGLVTSPYNLIGDQFNNDNDIDVRYSLSSVPRDMANLEAEGGETVLTDLNNDGQFGLYNITGPRHSKGGVPMYLPEQSFIFSDTPKMKFNRQELAEFGIESRKKMTPAKVSKRYQLNEFIGAMADENSDPIKVKSAELMLDKNLMSLSKLSFGQESKKQFSDGVPLASHPYLMSQGINPIEFTQKVENITREQAQQRMFDALTPEQQAQVMAIQEFIANSNQQGMMPQAAEGIELPKAQRGLTEMLFPYGRTSSSNTFFRPTTLNNMPLPPYGDADGDGVINSIDQFPLNPNLGGFNSWQMQTASNNNGGNASGNTGGNAGGSGSRSGGRSRGGMNNIAFDPATVEYYRRLGIDVNSLGIGQSRYRDTQRYNRNTGYYGDAKSNEEGFFNSWEGVYPELEKLREAIANQTTDIEGGNLEVKKFQRWLNDTYIPDQVAMIKQKAEAAGQEWGEQDSEDLKKRLLYDYGFDPNRKGRKFDGDFGTFTSSRRPIGFEAEPPPEKKGRCRCEDGSYSDDCCPKPGDPDFSWSPPPFDFFTQDLAKMSALALRDRDLFLPWQPAVEIPRLDYVLEEPTRQLADVNEGYNIGAQAFGAFGSRQNLGASLGDLSGKALQANANTFATVHGRNVNTVNKGKMMNAQLEAQAKYENRDRKMKLYDDTQLAQNLYLDEKNLDREQMADLYANALTNASNAYNLSMLYDNYNIDPVSGGNIYFTNPRMFNPSQQSGNMTREELLNLAREINATGSKVSGDALLQQITGLRTASADPKNQMLEDARNQYAGTGYTNQQAKKGKEVKPYVVPFYTGKMGS